jgi:ADP-L-glycero-D-manno-heptose 6-epimerase
LEEKTVKVLVTGGAGFIGSNLAKALVAVGHNVTVFDDFQSGDWKNLIRFKGDIVTSAERFTWYFNLEALAPFDVVFHQASITDTTVVDQRKMMTNNVEGFRVVLTSAATWRSRVIWASSASIYGQGPAPMKESADPNPLNVYAYSKLAMERLAEQYAPKLAEPIIGLRYFNVYGPGEDHKGKFASMIHQLAKQMRAGHRPKIFTAGQQRRDFVYVDDVIQGNLKAMECQKSGIYNIGSGGSYSFNQVVSELNRVLKTDLQPEYIENPYSFTQDWTEADLSKSRFELEYEPIFPLDKGIDAYMASGKLGMANG